MALPVEVQRENARPVSLQSILDRALQLLPCDAAAILVRTSDQRDLQVAAVAGACPIAVGVRLALDDDSPVTTALTAAAASPPAVISTADVGALFGQPGRALAVPIQLDAAIAGLIVVYAEAGSEPFGGQPLALLETLAQAASLVLMNEQLIEQERGQRQRAAATLEIARATTSTLELNEVLEQVVQTITRLTGANRCSLWLLDAETRQLTTAAISGMDSTFVASWRYRRFNLDDEPLSKHVLETGEPLPIYDAMADPLTNKQAVQFFGDKSILVLPLICRGISLGTLFINHTEQFHAFQPHEIEFTQTLAGQAAVAIYNAQLYEETRETGRLLRWSMRQLGALAPAAGLDQVLDCIVAVAAELVKVPACGLRLIDERAQEMTFRATRGIPAELIELGRLKVTEGIAGEVVRQAAPVIVEDLWQESQARLPEFVRAAGLRGFLGVPLILNGEVIGVLSAYSQRPYRFSDDQVDLLSSFANQAVIAIENATLLAEANRRAHELALLHAASTALSQSLDLQQVLEIIGQRAQEMVQAHRTAIFILNDQTGEVERAVDLPLQRRPVRDRPRPHGLTHHILQTGEMLIIDNAVADRRVRPELIAEGIRSMLGMPLKVDDRIVGLLWLNSMEYGHFTRDYVELLGVMANQISAALRNAWLYNRAIQEKEKFAAIFESSTDGILLIDQERKVVDLNPAFERMLAWPADQARGATCRTLFGCSRRNGENPCRDGCMIQQFLEGESSKPYLEATVIAHDGREVEIAASFSRILSTGDEHPFAVCIARDVTEAKRIEAAKSDFVSMVSHELRTPLSLVKGYASTLLREDLSFDEVTQRRFVHNIDMAADRLTRLINDLLSVSRLELGRFELRPQPVELCGLVQRTASLDQWQASHRVQVMTPPSPIRVQADPDRIEQVLHNLLRNGSMYSRPGTTLRIELVEVTDVAAFVRETLTERPGWRSFTPTGLPSQGHWAVIRIVDEGVGLSDEDMPRIFEKFYRVDRGLEAKTSGMGIGLFLARGLVEAHGGRIWVQTARDQGCAFGFCLPVPSPEDASVVQS